jgi:hypothetical protein
MLAIVLTILTSALHTVVHVICLLYTTRCVFSTTVHPLHVYVNSCSVYTYVHNLLYHVFIAITNSAVGFVHQALHRVEVQEEASHIPLICTIQHCHVARACHHSAAQQAKQRLPVSTTVQCVVDVYAIQTTDKFKLVPFYSYSAVCTTHVMPMYEHNSIIHNSTIKTLPS